jgi:hypothetical protein
VLALAQPRLALVCALLFVGWWWGSARLQALDRSELAQHVGTAGRVLVHVSEPPRRGRFDVRVRAVVRSWRGARMHEPVLLKLPGSRAPPPLGAELSALVTVRPPADYERTWLRRHGVHVVLRASAWSVVRRRGGVADRLHAWLARASTPGLTGERRAVLEGVVLGEDGGLSDELRGRFRASGLYHLLSDRQLSLSPLKNCPRDGLTAAAFGRHSESQRFITVNLSVFRRHPSDRRAIGAVHDVGSSASGVPSWRFDFLDWCGVSGEVE